MELRDVLKNTDLSYRADQVGWDRKTVEAEKKKIETAKKAVEDLRDELAKAKIDKRKAERNGNKAEVKRCESDIKRIEEEIDRTIVSLTSQKRKLEAFQKSTDNHLKHIGEVVQGRPDLAKEFDETIKSKFSKALADKKKRKDEAEKKIAPYKLIRETAKKDPSVASMISAIEVHSQTIKEQEKIISDPSTHPRDRADAQTVLASAQKAVAAQRKKLGNKFKGKVKPEDIAKIQSLSTLDRDIAKADKQIKGYDSQISQYEQAIKDIEAKQKTQGQDKKQSLAKGKKPKWYQFIKKFKNWYHKYDKPDQDPPQPSSEEDKKAFKESMKYDVMKAYSKRLEEEYLDKAKSEVEAQQQDQDQQR